MDRPEPAQTGRAAVVVLVVLLVLALGAAIVYLLADINSRHYRIGAQGASLVVERGRRLPWGFERYEPTTAELQAAYAPIPIPPGESVTKTEIYEDRADIDRALFSLFAGWARARLESKTPGDFDLATSYVHRSELLPSLSEEQRLELKRLRADLAYKNGRRLLDDIVDRLQKALTELKLARELGATKPNDVDRWILEVERRVHEYSAPLAPASPALPAEAPLPTGPSGAVDDPRHPGAPSTPAAPATATPAAPGAGPQSP